MCINYALKCATYDVNNVFLMSPLITLYASTVKWIYRVATIFSAGYSPQIFYIAIESYMAQFVFINISQVV